MDVIPIKKWCIHTIDSSVHTVVVYSWQCCYIICDIDVNNMIVIDDVYGFNDGMGGNK